jgi:hypothetical protein
MQCGTYRLLGLAGGVLEAQGHTLFILVEAGAAVVRDHRIGAHALAHGRQQHALQVSPVDRELGPLVAGMAAGRLAVHELAMGVVERRLFRRYTHLRHGVEEAEVIQLTHRVRQDVDADAERLDLGGRFENAARDAGCVQAEGRRKAADTGADDGDVAVEVLLGHMSPCVSISAGLADGGECAH